MRKQKTEEQHCQEIADSILRSRKLRKAGVEWQRYMITVSAELFPDCSAIWLETWRQLSSEPWTGIKQF